MSLDPSIVGDGRFRVEVVGSHLPAAHGSALVF